MEQLYIERWQLLLAHLHTPWIVFAHGTCILIKEISDDTVKQAVDLMGEWPVRAGSELGDFNIITLSDVPGWVITCAHPDIKTYLAPEEIEQQDVPSIFLGLQGRAKRHQDAQEKRIIFTKP